MSSSPAWGKAKKKKACAIAVQVKGDVAAELGLCAALGVATGKNHGAVSG